MRVATRYGHEDLVHSVRQQLAPRVAVVHWLDDNVLPHMPGTLRDLAWHVASAPQSNYPPDLEAHVRRTLALGTHTLLLSYTPAMRCPVLN